MSPAPFPVHALYPPAGFLFGLKVRHRGTIMDAARVLRHIPRGADVLDIGCGTGLLLMELSSRGHAGALAGLDLSEGAVGLAARAAEAGAARGWPAPDFRVSSGTGDWPGRTFGAVTMVDVMHHVPIPARKDFLAEAMSRVAPGGLLVYKDMSATPWWCGLGNRAHDLILSGERISYEPIGAVEARVEAAGFEVVARDAWRQLWYAHECLVARRPE